MQSCCLWIMLNQIASLVLSTLCLAFLKLLIGFTCWASVILKFSIPCILLCQHTPFKLHQPNYVFSFLYTILRDNSSSAWHLVLKKLALTFMGPCIIYIFLSTTNKMQRYTIFVYCCQCCTCFERFFCSSSGAKNQCMQHWVLVKL